VNARRAIKRILLLGALFAVGILVFNFMVMPTLVHQRDAVIVPDLRTLSESQATEALTRLSLKIKVGRSEYDPQVPKGYVVSQSPRSAESIKTGRTVTVVTSLGPRTTHVPDVTKETLRQAREVIGHAGLVVGRVSKVKRAGDERDAVIATNPPAGEELRAGEVVDLVVAVAGGGASYLMPDVTKQDLFFVRDKLERLGFRVASVRYEVTDGVFPNTIIDQRPKAGARIQEGESVELVASSSR
jgi:eukaryotic-like serine/threonine-protein kinase